jgi:predicted phage terminase large subunit-like protein
MGSYAYSGQYQQSPTPRSGGMFQRGDFEIVDACRPAAGGRAWDFAASQQKPGKQPDWTVGLRMLMVKDTFYVEDVLRGRWSASEVETNLKNTASQDGQMVTVRMPQDPGAAGKADAETKVKLLKGYAAVVKPITGDKATRARPASAQAEAGNVKLLRGPWNDTFLTRCALSERHLRRSGGCVRRCAERARAWYRRPRMGAVLNILDRLTNIMSGKGTTADRACTSRYAFVPLDPQQAEAAYRSSWLVRKIIDIPPFDMTREWRDWQADAKNIEKLEAEERRLQLKAKCQRALSWRGCTAAAR